MSSRFTVKWVRSPDSSAVMNNVEVETMLNLPEKWLASMHIRDLSFIGRPLPQISHAIAINNLPDGPVRKVLAEPGSTHTNALALLKSNQEWEEKQKKKLWRQAKSTVS